LPAVFKRQRETKGDQFKFKCRRMVHYCAIRSKPSRRVLLTRDHERLQGVLMTLQDNGTFLVCFPYVCPEPVLVT
jgi:hypothetical protein